MDSFGPRVAGGANKRLTLGRASLLARFTATSQSGKVTGWASGKFPACVKREVGSKTDGQRWARVAFRVLRRVEAGLLLTWANCGCDVRMQVGGKRNSSG